MALSALRMRSFCTTAGRTYTAEYLQKFTTDVFAACGVPLEDAKLAASVLAASDVRGIESHGVARLLTYVELLKADVINPTPELKIDQRTATTATIDGDNGLGLVVGPKANLAALEMAEGYGSGWVSVMNTNHYGIAGYYAMEAAKRDMIGISMTNTTKLVAPLWGSERMLGTNPIGIAIPAGAEPPLIIDFATSAVAYGKIEIADRLGKSIPHGWGIDETGASTTDPHRMRENGALLPLGSTRDMGGHKGYCLSAWVDIMSAVLSGANWGPFAPPFTLRGGVNATSERVGKGIGHFFGAWRVDGFRDKEEFKAEMDKWIQTFRNTKPEAGKQVLIPGDPERLAEVERRVSGIPLPGAVVRDLLEVSEMAGVPFER